VRADGWGSEFTLIVSWRDESGWRIGGRQKVWKRVPEGEEGTSKEHDAEQHEEFAREVCSTPILVWSTGVVSLRLRRGKFCFRPFADFAHLLATQSGDCELSRVEDQDHIDW
jgi:hypothetical protein